MTNDAIHAAIHAYFHDGTMPDRDKPWRPPDPAGSTYWAPAGTERNRRPLTDDAPLPDKLAPGPWD